MRSFINERLGMAEIHAIARRHYYYLKPTAWQDFTNIIVMHPTRLWFGTATLMTFAGSFGPAGGIIWRLCSRIFQINRFGTGGNSSWAPWDGASVWAAPCRQTFHTSAGPFHLYSGAKHCAYGVWARPRGGNLKLVSPNEGADSKERKRYLRQLLNSRAIHHSSGSIHRSREFGWKFNSYADWIRISNNYNEAYTKVKPWIKPRRSGFIISF